LAQVGFFQPLASFFVLGASLLQAISPLSSAGRVQDAGFEFASNTVCNIGNRIEA
jgi:hypothetical protein